MSDSIEDILQELGRAVAGAMSGADPVHDVVQRLRRHGYQFELLLDLRATPDEDVHARLGAGALHLAASAESSPVGSGSSSQATETERVSVAEPQPQFTLDADDAAFLRSLGIDPSRTGKSRRR